MFLAWLQKQGCGCRCAGLAPEDTDFGAMQQMLKIEHSVLLSALHEDVQKCHREEANPSIFFFF